MLCKHRHKNTPPQLVLFTRYLFMVTQMGFHYLTTHDSAGFSGRHTLGIGKIMNELAVHSVLRPKSC